jgi:hypothetical protein
MKRDRKQYTQQQQFAVAMMNKAQSTRKISMVGGVIQLSPRCFYGIATAKHK